MDDSITVIRISRLSEDSVYRARKAVCIEFSDGNHVVITPNMGKNVKKEVVVKSICAMRLACGCNLLTRVDIGTSGVVRYDLFNTQQALERLKSYITSADKDIRSPRWRQNPDLTHVRAVVDGAISSLYPEFRKTRILA